MLPRAAGVPGAQAHGPDGGARRWRRRRRGERGGHTCSRGCACMREHAASWSFSCLRGPAAAAWLPPAEQRLFCPLGMLCLQGGTSTGLPQSAQGSDGKTGWVSGGTSGVRSKHAVCVGHTYCCRAWAERFGGARCTRRPRWRRVCSAELAPTPPLLFSRLGAVAAVGYRPGVPGAAGDRHLPGARQPAAQGQPAHAAAGAAAARPVAAGAAQGARCVCPTPAGRGAGLRLHAWACFEPLRAGQPAHAVVGLLSTAMPSHACSAELLSTSAACLPPLLPTNLVQADAVKLEEPPAPAAPKAEAPPPPPPAAKAEPPKAAAVAPAPAAKPEAKPEAKPAAKVRSWRRRILPRPAAGALRSCRGNNCLA